MNTYLLNGDLPRRRLAYDKPMKNAYTSFTDDGLQEELNKLLEEVASCKRQLDTADEQHLKNRIPINHEWYERAERALTLKNKQIGYIQHLMKQRRRQAHALQVQACEANKELAKVKHEITAFRSTMEERVFVKVCAERLDRILYLSIWEEVKSRMNDFNEPKSEHQALSSGIE